MRRLIAGIGFIASCLMALGDEPEPRSYEQINANVTKRNIESFENYLAKCNKEQIRCIWFLGDHIKVGMIMTIDLQNYTVSTVREVYDHASQCNDSRRMSGSQIASAKGILPSLPASKDNVLFGRGVHIAFWRDGHLQRVTYNRYDAPLILQRLYDIGGGEIDCTYAKNQQVAEPAGADQPATKPANKDPVKAQPSTPTSKDGPR